MEKRYNELIEIINKANIEYYTMDKPSFTDQEYDRYMQELLKIEEKYPEIIKEDSPRFSALSIFFVNGVAV